MKETDVVFDVELFDDEDFMDSFNALMKRVQDVKEAYNCHCTLRVQLCD